MQQFSELNYPELEPSDSLYNEENEYSRAHQGVSRRDNIYTPNTKMKMGKNVNRRWEDVLNETNDDNDDAIVSHAVPSDNEYANKDVYSYENGKRNEKNRHTSSVGTDALNVAAAAGRNANNLKRKLVHSTETNSDFVGLFKNLDNTDEIIKNDVNVFASVLTESGGDKIAASKKNDMREYYSLQREDATKTCKCCDCDKCVNTTDVKRCACCYAMKLCSCTHGSKRTTHKTDDNNIVYLWRDKQHKNRCCDCSESSILQSSEIISKNGNNVESGELKPISRNFNENTEHSSPDAVILEPKARHNKESLQKRQQRPNTGKFMLVLNHIATSWLITCNWAGYNRGIFWLFCVLFTSFKCKNVH